MATITQAVNTVVVLKTCPFCEKVSRFVVEADDYDLWLKGELIQNVWPDLEPEEREVIRTGTHPSCWP